MHHHHLSYWLAALYLPGVGPRKLMRWLEQFSDIDKLFKASYAELQVAKIPAQHIKALQNPDWKSVEKDLLWNDHPHHHLITLYDEHYPPLLKEIADPPFILYVRGNPSALMQTQIAIVGSRHATPAGLQNAEQFAGCLVEVGFAVTSGLAAGIDGAAHKGAIAAGGITIAVSGTGLNHIYPSSHRALAEQMIDYGGAIISEFPLATPPQAANFPRRNRIISGLSKGVLVVESALKSGSLVTARHALDQGREVFAIPGSIHHPLSRGCHFLIRQGAKLVETAADIIEELSLPRLASSPREKAFLHEKTEDLPAHLPVSSQQLLEQIGYEITPLDVILSRSRLTTGEVSSILLTLELNGYVQSVAGGYIRVVVRNEGGLS